MKFTIVFKSGAVVDVTAESATTERNTITNQLTGYRFKNTTENIPMYLNLNEVAGIFQKAIHEEEEENHATV